MYTYLIIYIKSIYIFNKIKFSILSVFWYFQWEVNWLLIDFIHAIYIHVDVYVHTAGVCDIQVFRKNDYLINVCLTKKHIEEIES